MLNVKAQAVSGDKAPAEELDLQQAIQDAKPAYKGFKSSRPPKAHGSPARAPLISKSIDHTFGCKNLPSDEIGKLVSNKFMVDAAAKQVEKDMEIARQRASLPKGLKQK